MANTAMRGFRWARSVTGATTQPTPITCRVATAYNGVIGSTAVDLNIGDPVTRLSTGYHGISAGSEGTQVDIFGIIVGFGPYYDGTRMVYNKKLPNQQGSYGTNLERMTYIQVVPVEGQLFEVDADDGTTATTEAAFIALIGENCDHVLTTGSEPDANPLLDISTHNTTYSLQWRIEDISKRIDQDYTATRVKLIVRCNRVQEFSYAYASSSGAGTTGV